MRPSQEYTIHILDDAEFDMLPVGNPKEALGMSDPKKKVAWVRRTNVRDLDLGTINHEFDELMANMSYHEVDGIRYKGFKDVIRTIFNIVLPGVGSAIIPESRPSAPTINFQPSQATSAFSPAQSTAASPSPLSDIDFKTGLSNIDANRANQRSAVFSQFRGLGTPQQNTAFSRALGNVESSYGTSRDQFIRDQEERKRLAGIV